MDNRNLHIKSVITLIALIALCFSCITIKNFGIPSTVQAGETVEFTVDWDFDAETERSPEYYIFAMLVPKSWGVANTAQVSFSTENLASQLQYKEDIKDEVMTLMDPAEIEPSTGLPYASACNAVLGQGGNYGSMEWVCFKSKTWFATDGSDAAQGIVKVTNKIRLKVGGTNLKFNMGIAILGTVNGFGGEYKEYSDPLIKTVTVEGGSGDDDYTTPKLVSTTPSEIGYGDIFCINFSTNVDGAESILKEEEEVFVRGIATLSDSRMVEFPAKSDKTKMETVDKLTYTKYVYLPVLLGISPSDKIESLTVWFENKDGDKVEKGPEGAGFSIKKAN